MPAMKSPTVAAIRDRLTVTYDSADRRDLIKLDDEVIGRMVSYGSSRGGRQISARTVYASRIYSHGVSIEEEASTRNNVLRKVSVKVAAAMRENRWRTTPRPGAETAEAVDEESASRHP